MDFSKFLFPPFEKSTLDALEQFPEFQFKIQDKAKIIDYMIIMYDHNNAEFRRLHTDYYTRKREAAILAKLPTGKDGKFPEQIEEVLTGLNDDFNTALVRYLMMFGLPDYPQLVALKELQAQELKAAFSPSEAKDRKIMRDNLDKITNDIAIIEDKIYYGTETENVRKALYRYMEANRLALRPEHIAEATRSGNLKQAING